jgi:NAD(P)H-hydrate repair Nnr-like enzyme with NAD(P)H-hydrate dehydratase domain
MPYFIYKVTPQKKLTALGEHTAYRDAREQARTLREQLDAGDDASVRIIFAPHAGEAERLLTTEREFVPMGDD